MTPFTIDATDGYPLAATRYEAERGDRPRVIVAGATGVPQRFYRRFAEFLAAAGHEVVTFDYRGIGASRRGSLAGFQADFLTWAERDLEAVVSGSLATRPTAVVGHSFGGHAFGLLSKANETLGLYTFGTGAGWHGHMPVSERPRVLFFWNVLGPLATRTAGYWPASRFGMGEDLPLGVYQQWRRWCRYPSYFFEDQSLELERRFEAVRVPLVAVNAIDDQWAPPRSAKAFMEGYVNAPLDLRVIRPARPVGHLGYFKPGAQQEALWRDTLIWLENSPMAAAPRRTTEASTAVGC